MALTPNNFQTASAATATTITEASYVVSAGDRLKILAFVGLEDTGTAPNVTGVTWGGVAFSPGLIAELELDTGPSNVISIWEHDLGSSNDTQNIVATADQTISDLKMVCCYFTDAQQSATTNSQTGSGTSSPENNTITGLTTGNICIDGLSAGQNNALAPTQGPDQVEQAEVSGGSSRLAVSTKAVDASSETLGWSQSSPNRLVHAIVEIVEDTGGAGPTYVPRLTLTGVG